MPKFASFLRSVMKRSVANMLEDMHSQLPIDQQYLQDFPFFGGVDECNFEDTNEWIVEDGDCSSDAGSIHFNPDITSIQGEDHLESKNTFYLKYTFCFNYSIGIIKYVGNNVSDNSVRPKKDAKETTVDIKRPKKDAKETTVDIKMSDEGEESNESDFEKDKCKLHDNHYTLLGVKTFY